MFDYRRVIQGIQARVRCMGDWAIAAQDVLEAPLCIFATLPEPIATYDRPQVSILSHTCWSSQQVITMRVIHVRCSTNKAVIRLPSMLGWSSCGNWSGSALLGLVSGFEATGWFMLVIGQIGPIGQVPASFCWRPWDPTCCYRPTRSSCGTVRKVLCSPWP